MMIGTVEFIARISRISSSPFLLACSSREHKVEFLFPKEVHGLQAIDRFPGRVGRPPPAAIGVMIFRMVLESSATKTRLAMVGSKFNSSPAGRAR